MHDKSWSVPDNVGHSIQINFKAITAGVKRDRKLSVPKTIVFALGRPGIVCWNSDFGDTVESSKTYAGSDNSIRRRKKAIADRKS